MTTTPTTQPEQVLENELVAQLIGNGFKQVTITDEASILANLKVQLEAFNGLAMTDGEFTKVLHHLNRTSGVFAKAKTLRDRMKLEKKGGKTVYLEFFDSVNPTHLGTMIGKYIVLNYTGKILMVLRPYQYYATEAIVERVKHPPEEKANGYIWHTTGSGKTLTSFKAAQIITGLPDV